MNKSEKKTAPLLFLVIILFMLFFSSATSPLYLGFIGWNSEWDSAYYRFIGTSIREGKVAYLDIWDNKGPVFYFIQTIGTLHGTVNEKISLIFVMQVVSIFLSVYFMKLTDRMISARNGSFRFLLIIINSVSILAAILEGGNLTEEWSLPMICCSLYFFTKYLLNAENEPCHPRAFAFVHGVNLALVFFIRINNAVTICAAMLFIGIYLVKKHQWENFFENIVFAFSGFISILIPVFIYFIYHNALGEMLHALLIYNMNYAKHRSHTEITGVAFFIRYLPIALSLVMMLIHHIKTKYFRLIDVFAVFIVVVNMALLFVTNTYLHYFVIFIPVYIFIMILYVPVLTTNSFIKQFSSNVQLLFIFVVSVLFMIEDGKFLSNSYNQAYVDKFESFSIDIPKNERNSAIAIDVQPSIYLNTGIIPVSRFAAYQSDFLTYESKFEEEFIMALQVQKPLWIITHCTVESQNNYLSDLINANYEYRFNNFAYCFYRLNE